ncbi:keratin-associated protein 19-2-like [Parasteatoda tepidariorum]|uniref:keratin-associated protein 19-2-like n=1 Tax=Parasteatoda tepidariorum TaxID=114398 RepID=UPI001C71B417|nr:keratin-associated protein 19-2-like [Parasteatoda tepidariorum]XP_042909450.1 keratin-associated protein 19-2-like [Parasteatoda tepidariorum]XP_042909451.1 keratin-associated protein 19-2-like [Parasteatoda tepidariorum]
MIKIALFFLACFAFVYGNDVIHHYGKHGGHGVSSRYFIKSQGHGLGYGGYGLGYGGYGLGYGGSGLGYGGYGLGYGSYGAGYGGYGRYGYGF